MVETAVKQFLNWDAQGTPSWKAPGILKGGGRRPGSPGREEVGVGGQVIQRAGKVAFKVTADFIVTTDSPALLAYAIRASYPAGALSPLMMQVGTEGADHLYEDGLIDALTIKADDEGSLEASLEAIFLSRSAETGEAIVAATDASWEWYEGVVTVGAEYPIKSLEIAQKNGLNPFYGGIGTKTPGIVRWPQSIELGLESIAVKLDTYEPITTWDGDADTPATDIGAVVVLTHGTDVLTFTLTNLAFEGDEDMPIVTGSEFVTYGYNLKGRPGSLAITPPAGP